MDLGEDERHLMVQLQDELRGLKSLCDSAAKLASGWAGRLDTMLNGYGQQTSEGR
jgi:hypothetical protein